jgi:hypothetical protein
MPDEPQSEPNQPNEVILSNRRMMSPAFYPNARLQRLYYFSPNIDEQPPFPIRHEMSVRFPISLGFEVEPDTAVLRSTATPISPPIGAYFLLDLFLAKADRAAIPGDMQEDFWSDLSKYGARRARFLFWTRTLGAIAWRNPVCRWLLVYGLARLGEWILRKLSS